MNNKLVNSIKRFSILLATILTGSLLVDIWITKDDDWKTYLPIILICIMFERFMSLKDE